MELFSLPLDDVVFYMKNSAIYQMNISDNLFEEDNLATLDSHLLKSWPEIEQDVNRNSKWANLATFYKLP